MTLLDRIHDCSPPRRRDYSPFSVAGETVGFIGPDFADVLNDFPHVFRVSARAVALSDRLRDFDERTAAMATVLDQLMDQGHVPGWRGEHYGVGTSFASPAFFSMERAAVPLFGSIGYGVHLNGVVHGRDGLAMWIGRRSLSKPTGPGKLDQIVAGGQPVGLSVLENLAKECAEEADIGADLAAGAVPTGAISYVTERPEGLRRDVLFIYDLVLPQDFTPRNTDGEIEDFRLLPIADVVALVDDTDDFKFNCSLVVIDFLMRHGYIEADHPDYMEILHGLRSLDSGTRKLNNE